jgi:putative zinc finger/helix-turn-helix YgiT family protein
MDFTTDVKHDGVVHRIHLPGLEVPRCQSCGETIITNAVDEQINNALRRHLRLLTPSQMRQGVKALGLSQQELAERLGVAKETISRWVNGALIQSRAMDNYLRVYFAVPEARAVLRGEEQDPCLGVTAAPEADPPVSQTPRSVLVAAFRTTEVRERVKRSAAPVHWHPFPVGAN